MLNGTLRYCSHIRCFNPVTAIASNGFVEAATVLGSSRNYSNDKGSCCKDIAQSQGKKVEPWPKAEPPPPAWRVECPRETQPPNYDPYRIKVPDIACQPLPPSNAKWTAVLTTPTPESGGQGGGFQQPSQQQQGFGQYPNYGQQNPQATEEQSEEEAPPSTGFFGFLKGLFRRKGKTGRGEGEVSMIDGRKSPTSLLYYLIHWDVDKKLPSPASDIEEPLPRLGYHGKNKYKYAFHEPWKPLDRLSLLSQAEKQEFGHPEETDIEKY